LDALTPGSSETKFCLQQQKTKAGDKDYEFEELLSLVSTCLVIDCNKLSHYTQYIFTGKYSWRARFRHQMLGQCSLCFSLSSNSLFFVFHFLPDHAWDCPVVLGNVFLLAPLLIFRIVLTDVLPIGRISTSMKSFSLAVFFYKCIVVSIKSK
jgi:hypothetical protein